MKRIINYLMAVAVMALALTSCHNDLDATGEGFPTDVTLSVSVPNDLAAVKSNDNPGDGSLINRCILEIYEDGVLYGERYFSDVTDLSAEFKVRLITGHSYDFVFWADCAEGSVVDGFTDLFYNTESLAEITLIDGVYRNNDDRLDAFYGNFSQQIDNSQSFDFSLTRPFGQMNLYTLDLASVPDDVDLSNVQAKVSFTEVPAGFNAIENKLVEGRVDITPVEYVVPVNFPQAGETPAEEAQISFDYLFASPAADATLVGFVLELVQNGRDVCPAYPADNIPVRQNYRTNVKSNFLTDYMEITVNLDPIFSDPDTNIGGGDEDTDELVEATIEEFLAAEVSTDVWYQLTGTISNIANETYGNLTIEDETGSVYIYGLTATRQESNDRSFSDLGLKVGDILTLATLRGEHNGEAQGGGSTNPAYYISHEEGDVPAVVGDPMAVIISEYVEGSSNNKYLEIANISENEVDLAAYTLIRYTNGNEDNPTEVRLSGTLAPGAVKVYMNSQASLTLPDGAVAESNSIPSFNGNDPIALTCNGERVDLLGILNSEEMWGENVTLRRKATVTQPSATYNVDEWDVLETDDVSNLGSLTPAEDEDVIGFGEDVDVEASDSYINLMSTRYTLNKFSLQITTNGGDAPFYQAYIYFTATLGTNGEVLPGTYTIGSDDDQPFSIVRGDYEENDWGVQTSGSYARYMDENWNTLYSVFTSGTMTIGEDGAIALDFATADGHTFKMTYPAGINYGDIWAILVPGTTLTGDFTAEIPAGGTATATRYTDYWKIILEPASGTDNSHAMNIEVSAEGKTFADGPAGTYSFASPDGGAGSFMPGIAWVTLADGGGYYNNSFNGTVYRSYGKVPGGWYAFNGNYATIDGGTITITDNGDGNYTILVEGVDINGNSVDVTYTGALRLIEETFSLY